ncbi:MAG: hypothetical protein R2818_12650 [Flavobacteriales bacterium]
MRHILFTTSLLLAATVAAQWTTPDLNTAVSATTGVGAATPLSAPGPDGSTYACWFENSTGAYVLKMQRLDADGNALWATGGIVVSAENQNTALFRYDFKSDNAGNAIVAFQDERSGSLDVVAYKIGPDGQSQWPGGIPLLTPSATGLAPVIGVLADDRIVFAWNTDRSPATVAYLIVEPNGTFSGVPFEVGGSGITGRPKVVPTSDGGFWLQYVHQTGNFLSPGTMYTVRCDASGTPGPEINVAAATISGFYFPEPVSDQHDGFYVAFNTGNVANGNLTDVNVQRVRANGINWSTNGVAVEDGVLTQRYTGTATPALVSDDDGLFMAYSITNLNQSEGGIAVQKFDTAGVVAFGATGSIVEASSSARPQPFGTIATPSGIIAAYTTGEFGNVTAHALQVDLNGAVVQPVIDLCTTPSGKDDATITPFRNGQAVAVWQDERNGGSIYAQPILLDINIGLAEQRDDGIVLLGGAAPSLLFRTATPATTLCITDVNGRLLHEQRLPAQAEGAQVLLPLGDASGVYLVVLDGDHSRIVKRVVR